MHIDSLDPVTDEREIWVVEAVGVDLDEAPNRRRIHAGPELAPAWRRSLEAMALARTWRGSTRDAAGRKAFFYQDLLAPLFPYLGADLFWIDERGAKFKAAITLDPDEERMLACVPESVVDLRYPNRRYPAHLLAAALDGLDIASASHAPGRSGAKPTL